MQSFVARVGIRVVGGAAAAALVLAGLVAVAQAEEPVSDAAVAGLLPGQVMQDQELEEVHGKGLVVSFGGNLSLEGTPFNQPPNLRAIVMGSMRGAGVRPSLNPAGPNGIAGGGRIALPRLPATTIRIPTPAVSVSSDISSMSSTSSSGF